MAFEESLRVDKRKDAITEVGVTRDYTSMRVDCISCI